MVQWHTVGDTDEAKLYEPPDIGSLEESQSRPHTAMTAAFKLHRQYAYWCRPHLVMIVEDHAWRVMHACAMKFGSSWTGQLAIIQEHHSVVFRC
jgi:hypothetical protein